MMPSPLNLHVSGAGIPTYPSDAILDELSRQMAASQAARRYSRGSNPQQQPHIGMSMRIAKPSSANNSPRSSMTLGRRRTLVLDGNIARRRHQVVDQVALSPVGAEMVDHMARTARPVSWHPTSNQPQHQQLQLQQQAAHYPFNPVFNDHELYASYPQISPVPASYSCNASPSTFSPLSLPYNDFNTHACLPVDGWNLVANPPPSYVSPTSESSLTYAEAFPALSTTASESTQSSSATEWNSFVMRGFNSTSPPTPENLPQTQQPRTAMQPDGMIPYQPLEEPEEEEGEILVGMGLYDPPEKFENDPHLNNYRTTVTSLLGSTFKAPEPTGKGLKLEETWEPPESDDDDDDDEDDDDEEDPEEP